MARLRRTVRFSINPGGETGGVNGSAGIPAMHGLGRYYEIDLTCRGEPDPLTGYLVDIREIDRIVRTMLVPIIAKACEQTPTVHPATLMPRLVEAVRIAHLEGAESLRWRLSPYHTVEMPVQGSEEWAEIRVRFDFAAAHRLHVRAMSDEENRRVFGHCNNPNGHGHNYQIEPCVRVRVAASPMPVARIEELVKAAILDRFDHTNLNCDTAEFAPDSGVNPSVENMARVFFGLLEARIAEADPNASLVSMTVWETERTSATYPG